MAYVALVCCSLFWAGNFVVARSVRMEFEPVALNLLRWALALALFAPFAWSSVRASAAALRREWPLVLALGFTGVAAFQTLLFMGVFSARVVDVVLIVATAPAAVLLGNALVTWTAPPRAAVFGIALSFCGALTLIARGDWRTLAELSLSGGQLWMCAAVLFWTAYTLLLRRTPPDLSPKAALVGSMAAGALFLAPYGLYSLAQDPPDLTQPHLWAALGYFAVFASALALAFWTFGVGRLGPVRAGLFMNLTPLFGAGLAILFLGEELALFHLVGALFIGAGLWLVNRPALGAGARRAGPPPRSPAA